MNDPSFQMMMMNGGGPYPPPPPPMGMGMNMGMGMPPPTVMVAGGTHCISCGMPSQSISRRTLGCVACAWIFGLLFTVPILACIPCCCENCKDIQVICVRCGMMKNRIPAYCCN